MLAPTERFSSRVEDYVRYRPGYPAGIIELLRADCGLTSDSSIADIGSGTGKLAELFLAAGIRVFGVEPNREMREAGEQSLADYTNFTSIAGTAEATTLPASSFDFVTAGQAFHWFDQTAAATEFRRILKPKGWVVLVWNERSTVSPFQQDYEQLLLTTCADYAQVTHRNVSADDIRLAFDLDPFGNAQFENFQDFDFSGLQGRVLSSSYAPQPGHPDYPALIAGLEKLFAQYQTNGLIRFAYDTQVYYGQF
ncbi:MAG: class I SAM-dependent methyltransferase [Caldilineales bacterium]|nr:class I SAM-dependent methyltransferase [Caldilineales bacterium]